jgi:hypothetical protein
VFGSDVRSDSDVPRVDIKSLHAKIGELTLENDLYGGYRVKLDVFLGSVTALFLRPGLEISDAPRAGAVRTGRRPPSAGGLILTGSSTARCWA